MPKNKIYPELSLSGLTILVVLGTFTVLHIINLFFFPLLSNDVNSQINTVILWIGLAFTAIFMLIIIYSVILTLDWKIIYHLLALIFIAAVISWMWKSSEHSFSSIDSYKLINDLFDWNDENDRKALLAEFHGLILDLLFFGIFFTILEIRNRKRNHIDDNINIINDFRDWESKEAKYRIAGAVRRLNKNGHYQYDLSDISFDEIKFKNLIFNNSTFINTSFENSTLEYISFKKCNCENVSFKKASIKYLDFRESKLYKCDFRGFNFINNSKDIFFSAEPDVDELYFSIDDTGQYCFFSLLKKFDHTMNITSLIHYSLFKWEPFIKEDSVTGEKYLYFNKKYVKSVLNKDSNKTES